MHKITDGSRQAMSRVNVSKDSGISGSSVMLTVNKSVILVILLLFCAIYQHV